MSSRRALRPRFVRSAVSRLAVAALLLLTVQACGRKGDPQPPPQKHPARTTDLRVEQRGQELILSMSYPTMTVGGLALPGINRLELVQYTRPAPEFMEQPDAEVESELGAEPTSEPESDIEATEAEPAVSPAPAVSESAEGEIVVEDLTTEEVGSLETAPTGEAGTATEAEADADDDADTDTDVLVPEEPNPFLMIRVDPKEFDKQSETVLTLEGDALEAAVVGGQVVMRLPLMEVATEPPVAYTFSVRTFAGRLRSPGSSLASFVPLPPPATPRDLTAIVDERGIKLSWAALEDESGIEGYRVLRRSPPAASSAFEEVTIVEPGSAEHFDATARFGNRYFYAVTALGMEEPLVESALSEEQKVDFEDVFAPRQPQGLVALAEAGRTRLLWDASRERDLGGYLVFVSVGGGAPQQLTSEPIPGAEFTHEGTVSGTTYVYTVRAVDQAGNQSEDSSPATTRAP